MHIEKEYQIMELIMSKGILTMSKMKDGSNNYFVQFYSSFIEYDKDLGQALLKMLKKLYDKNYFKEIEEKEQVENLIELEYENKILEN